MVSRPVFSKRNSERHITECIHMISEEGSYFYKSTTEGDASTCGIYIFTEPEQNIEIQFNYIDVPCENGGLVVVVDGWELNGQLFPNPEDHALPFRARFTPFCGRKRFKEIVTSSQNVALIQYRISSKKSGFSFTVKFVKNPVPCNVLLQVDDVFTMRNHGKRLNCSLSSLFPAGVKLVAVDVGAAAFDKTLDIETGVIHKCNRHGLDDYVQIGGSDGLDNSHMEVADTICGVTSSPGKLINFVACGTTTVRLVSSGAYENSVTVALTQMTENDINGYVILACVPQDLEMK